MERQQRHLQKEERCIRIATYCIETGCTVRQAATKFGISKSTVHKDLTELLQHLDQKLYKEVQQVLQRHKAERHIRGGAATKAKYERERAQKPEYGKWW